MDWLTHLEHLQVLLKEFNFVATSNKNILIWYFWDRLRPSINIQLDKCRQNLDTKDKAINKIIYVKTNVSHQSLLSTCEINTQYRQDYISIKNDKLAKKSKKLGKIKFSYSFFANLGSQANEAFFDQALVQFSNKKTKTLIFTTIKIFVVKVASMYLY